MPMESVIRNHTYKDYDLILSLQAKDFPEKDCQGWPWIPDVRSLEFMKFKHKPIQFGLNLWKRRSGVANRSLRAKNSQFLKSYFFDFYGFIIQDVYRIVFLSDVCLLRKNVCRMASKMLRCQGMEAHLVAFIVKRISIAKKYSPTIKQILDNSNKAAETFDESHPPECTCPKIMHLGTSRGSAHGHCWIKSTNVEVKIILDIVSLNGRTRSFSEKGEAAIQITMAMKIFLTSCMKRSLQKDMSEDLFSIHKDLEATGTLGEVMVSKNDYIVAQNVLQVKSHLGSSIVAFLDKNDNCCIIVCARK